MDSRRRFPGVVAKPENGFAARKNCFMLRSPTKQNAEKRRLSSVATCCRSTKLSRARQKKNSHRSKTGV